MTTQVSPEQRMEPEKKKSTCIQSATGTKILADTDMAQAVESL